MNRIGASIRSQRWLSAIALITALAFTGCDRREAAPPLPEGEPVGVTVDPTQPQGKLAERYLGVAMDTAQLTGAVWWKDGEDALVPASAIDLTNAKLRRLASYLAPSLFRVGGTDCDSAYFCGSETPCEPPAAYRDTYLFEKERNASVITNPMIRAVAEFAEAIEAKIMFCLNVGPGPRDPNSGVWVPDNARALISYARSLPQSERFWIWEAGNEVNSLSLATATPKPISPSSFANDLRTFKSVVSELYPDALVAGPGSYIHPVVGELQSFTPKLLPLATDAIDVVTWHLYATQSFRCGEGAVFAPNPATLANLLDETIVDSNRKWAQQIKQAAGSKPVWNGESASAQCGGQPGISNTIADALWWADWIGVMAQEGSEAVVRQTLVGSDYGLLDPQSYDPRPAFLVSVLYRHTVARQRLTTTVDRHKLKAHAFCSTTPGALTIVLANGSDGDRTGVVALTGIAITAARQWVVSAPSPTAERGLINGASPSADGTITIGEGVRVAVDAGRAYVGLGPRTVAFVTLTTAAPIARCQ